MTEPLIPGKEIKKEEFDYFLHKTVLENDCRTETQTSSTSSRDRREEEFTPVEIKEENDSGEYDHDDSSSRPTLKPMSLAQMKRVSVVLVDCCRPQGQKRTDMQMQTNGDAEQPEITAGCSNSS
ncbi:hypothetical protein AALO_G00227500 [Alosa alosa]|uniref:Uncharacterized protein n=1 Tax=Alosa alosa TaxID=278164 RepID=A0AAV6G5L0_9TELE|nr:hypothetical protein AALO_G00227500 [Alosa alosa]